jgi:hypothetical protein
LLFASPVLSRRTRQQSEFQKQHDYEEAVRKLRQKQADEDSLSEMMKKLRSYKKECPRYEQVQVSEWQFDSDDLLTSTVTFPEVDHSTLTTRVDHTGEVIRVTGLREVQMPRSCLPASAKLTSDGQSEILEAVVRVPKFADGAKTEIDTFPDRLQLFVPVKKARCPQYKPTQVSDWDLDSENYLNVRVEVPDIDQSTVSTKLASSGSEIRVSGLRKLSPQALSCLPPDARVTKDKRHEILEVVIPVPEDGDGQKAEVETSSGQVQIFLPLKVRCPKHQPIQVSDWKAAAADIEMPELVADVALPGVEKDTIRVWADKDNLRVHVKAMRDIRKHRRECLPADAHVIANGGYEVLKVVVDVPPGRSAQGVEVDYFDDALRLYLPGEDPIFDSDGHHKDILVNGMVIEDHEYDWPEKDEGASEGYYDLSGVFREY